ncbi:hypothetical protein [Saccharothrix sp. Mg75]|uniref:hypothetical protein n=1 Tax=Saccharothrix sp. Mg75 TaxID=3445357 RepID=UPI003EE98D6F
MKIALVVLLALVTGCSTTVSGSGTGGTTVTTTTTGTEVTATTRATRTTETAGTTTEPTPGPVPTIDEGAPAQYCEQRFTGALGKDMLAVVVETPSGRLGCDEASAVLADYYAERREPRTGLPPLVVAGLTCNQVPEGQLPQVVCADADDTVYSIWPQT